ncbi:MAG TPA: hypothetical protein VGO35_04100 [Gammaproteobacteria bacterium]|jgi:O-antigen ligase|nr:hypothetical protein [Gammaproteobacteria bacterium]
MRAVREMTGAMAIWCARQQAESHAYQAETRKLVAAGEAAPDTTDYDHPHSDYFDALSSRGLVGLLALLGLPGCAPGASTA